MDSLTQVKMALPKGRLLGETASLLEQAGWGLKDYNEKARLYRLKSSRFHYLTAKLFQEKDIPVQVAIGNYDIGICGLDWIEELLARYPSSAMVKIKDLGYGRGAVFVAARNHGKAPTMKEIQASANTVRIASEYPNLAESFAENNRLRRFSIFPVWGGTEVYPPETADLALIPCKAGVSLNYGLAPLCNILNFSAFLIANKNSWETKDLSELIGSIEDQFEYWLVSNMAGSSTLNSTGTFENDSLEEALENTVWLALPDGHQQQHTCRLLARAGIRVDDYPSVSGNRRPSSNLPGVRIKVIRPQDMPLQVANGNFDLAVTGRDWLREHLYQFPSSPVKEFLDFKLGRVKIVAVISDELPVSDTVTLRQYSAGRRTPIRVASEYLNIADKFARDNRLGMYRVIPTWGASEAFLPEDADILIENTETGQTLARNNLKVIDTLFESTACLIGSTRSHNAGKNRRIQAIINKFRKAVEVTD